MNKYLIASVILTGVSFIGAAILVTLVPHTWVLVPLGFINWIPWIVLRIKDKREFKRIMRDYYLKPLR